MAEQASQDIQKLIETVDWESQARSGVIALTKFIPEVGTYLAAALAVLWPEKKPDVWDTLKDKVADLVDQKLLLAEKKERNNDLETVKRCLREFNTNPGEATLTTLVAECNRLAVKLLGADDSSKPHFLPLSLTFAHLHLGVLRERVVGGAKYGKTSAEWKKQLKEQIAEYSSHFRESFFLWERWRKAQIKAEFGGGTWTKSFCAVKDPLTNIEYRAEHSFYTLAEAYKRQAEYMEAQIFNEARRKFIENMYSLSFCLERYVNAEAKDKADDVAGRLSLGPFSPHLMISKKKKGSDPDRLYTRSLPELSHLSQDRPGEIIEIEALELADTIIGLQAKYTRGAGTFEGSRSAKATVRKFELKGRRILRADLYWMRSKSERTLQAIEFFLSDESRTGLIGTLKPKDRSRPTVVQAEGYYLIGINMAPSAFPGGTRGNLTAVKFDFIHNSLKPPRK